MWNVVKQVLATAEYVAGKSVKCSGTGVKFNTCMYVTVCVSVIFCVRVQACVLVMYGTCRIIREFR